MASIKKRGKTWSYNVSLGIDPITKKQIQKTKSGFLTREAAKNAAAELEYRSKVQSGRITTNNRDKFANVVEDWMSEYSH
ncbi:Arm DNA-binding domain-containing protein [Jeotgalibacillus terrae]|uniref:Arm DNA-binding domain-containing protein n=1 Tax=Jeotgalibacillus terrae TaxID=587735 RepID=A0ABW5ZMF7_9BACL|nr:hypothetical protein [Jeotgalibacillus terrae]